MRWHGSQISEMWTTRRKEAESYGEVRGFPLNHSILSPAMCILKQQMLMRLVFVTLFQNSNPRGNKKDLISIGKIAKVEFEKRREIGMQSVYFHFDWRSYF